MSSHHQHHNVGPSAGASTGTDDLQMPPISSGDKNSAALYESDLRGFREQSRWNLMGTYFESTEKPMPPTLGRYRKMFVGFLILAAITFPLNVILEKDSGSYSCTTDPVVQERVKNEVLGAMVVAVFKQMSTVLYFRAYVEVNHPEAAMVFNVDLDSLVTDDSAATDTNINLEFINVDALVAWYLAKTDNQKEMGGLCLQVSRLIGAAASTYEQTCMKYNSQTMPNVTYSNGPYRPSYNATLDVVNAAVGNEAMGATLMFLNLTWPQFYATNVNLSQSVQGWCSGSAFLAMQYMRINTICTDLDSVHQISNSLGKSIATKCLPRVHYEGVRWFAIFSFKTVVSILLSGAIVSTAIFSSSAVGRRRTSTVMF